MVHFIRHLMMGDEVVIKIPSEKRKEGYNPYPDGTTALVIGYSEMYIGRLNTLNVKPGIYLNDRWVKLQLLSGEEVMENSSYLTLIDKEEAEQRAHIIRQRNLRPNWLQLKLENGFLRELPETAIWEGDYVHCKVIDGQARGLVQPNNLRTFVVQEIDYHHMGVLHKNRMPWPYYKLSTGITGKWNVAVRESEMELVARGNVWKWKHQENLQFKNVLEEMKFWQLVGEYEELVNPATKNYTWSREEVFEAVCNGIAHGFKSIHLPLLGRSSSAIRMKDIAVGERLAKETLNQFRSSREVAANC